jgi:RsiW-degrading membrane proteinase PrsW (M82 family)
VFLLLAGGGFTLTIISVFAAIILLNPAENSYCVPLERSSSLLAGLAAAYVLHAFWNQPVPTGSELIGAALLLSAIVLLTVAPRFDLRRSRARSA